MSRGRYRLEVEIAITLDVTIPDAEGPEDAMRQARVQVWESTEPWKDWPVLDSTVRTDHLFTYKVNEKGLVS